VSDIKLFSVNSGKAAEIFGAASDLEKPLQTLIEKNLETLLGIRFLATEYSTGKTHGGRIDTLGLDENNCPVIVEYKRSSGENVVGQGLYYMNWLMDHKADFQLLAQGKLGADIASQIDWSAPRLVCIAADFTKYDSYMIGEIDRSIDLIRYRKFGDDLLLLELTDAIVTKSVSKSRVSAKKPGAPDLETIPANVTQSKDETMAERLEKLPPTMRDLFESLEGFVTSLGDDVQRSDVKHWIAFKRIRTFLTVQFTKNRLQLHLKLDPKQFELIDGFTRDKTGKGHLGSGDLEVIVPDAAALDRAKALIQQAYEGGFRAS
jgi:predicted transport protein